METRDLRNEAITIRAENSKKFGAKADLKKRKLKRNVMILAVFVFEISVALAITSVFGAVIIPMAYAERGYYAVGGEWLLLSLIAYLSYALVHERVFNIIKKQKGGKMYGRCKGTCGKVSGSADYAGNLCEKAGNSITKAAMDYQQRGGR